MNFTTLGRRLILAAALLGLAGLAAAHGVTAGDIVIGHPFATPTPPGATTGAAYFSTLENRGDQPDRLLRASTPVARAVQLHSMTVDAQGVMRMRELDGLALAPKQAVPMRQGGPLHLMLVDLKAPLKTGDTFAMTLEFAHAGKVEVQFVVQLPRPRDAPAEPHLH